MIALKWMYAATVVLGYGLLCAFFMLRHQHREALLKAQIDGFLNADSSTPACVVAHASQTGQAEELAFQTARFLHDAGQSVRLISLGELTANDLENCKRLLCIASTYGEGDAPDSAAFFVSRVMQNTQAELTTLEFAVLALGDRAYQHFCGFGHAVSNYLKACGARPLFDLIELDSSDSNAANTVIESWQSHLGQVFEPSLAHSKNQSLNKSLSGLPSSEPPPWQVSAALSPWLIRARQHLNPNSSGSEVHHIELVPAEGQTLPDWQAGDLVQLEVPGAPSAYRDYSIASVPADGAVHLLVRLVVREDGSPGLASSWLTQRAMLNDLVQMRIRTHRAFRIGDNAARPLVLIGNGTGLAGLRAHLRARFNAQAMGHGNNLPLTWLIFGERQAQFDSHYRDEIDGWLKQGVLTRVDQVFSRDQPQRRYVQHVLAECASEVREWVEQGAAIYVCGSLKGMAAEVDAQLKQILGQETVQQLSLTGRYRRDVY